MFRLKINLLEYSQIYSIASGSLWNYYRDKIHDVDDNASDGKSFKYKTKIVGNTPERPRNEGNVCRPPLSNLNIEVTIWVRYFSKFWIFLSIDKLRNGNWFFMGKRVCIDNKAGVNFVITSTKRYLPVVTLSINNNIKFVEKIKQEFKRKICWSKYRSEITTRPKSNNLDYLVDPTFRNINRLFVVSFKKW